MKRSTFLKCLLGFPFIPAAFSKKKEIVEVWLNTTWKKGDEITDSSGRPFRVISISPEEGQWGLRKYVLELENNI